MKKSAENIGLILLAAGASKRLGKPKQTLRFQNQTLLRRAVETAVNSVCRPLIVVLGANAEKLQLEIEEFDLVTVENADWEHGMGTSIKSGLEKLLEIQPDVSGVVLMVCDQPFVSAELIAKLVENFQATDSLVATSSYGETLGVPALFSCRLFPELLRLEADKGAKKIIYEHLENIVEITFKAGAIDIDTEQDYLNLMKWKTDNP